MPGPDATSNPPSINDRSGLVLAVGPRGDTNPWADAATVGAAAREVMDRALAPDQRDDRFDGSWPPDDLVAAIETGPDGSTGFLGGTIDRGRLQLDGLLVEGDQATGTSIEVRATRLWQAVESAVGAAGAQQVELWGHPARPWHQTLADEQGLVEQRALHQLRCPLPVAVPVDPIPTRPFRPGHDEEALIRVNNRAFASHPDQGGMTAERLAEAQAQPWFDPDGIRLHDDPDRPGVLAGFCWTKIHEPVAQGQPRLGEIYAIGVDPDHHGKGLGVPMTAAGLDWLTGQGLTTGMLYVEADNEPALRTYDRLGFRHHRTDRAWRRDLGR